MNAITHLRIVKVDLDGFNGRDNHPTIEDQGEVVAVQSMAIEYWDHDDTDPDTGAVIPQRSGFGVWECLRADGTPVTLIDHEVEITPL